MPNQINGSGGCFMDPVTLARAFFGTSLAFHIIFATLGIGLSTMVFLSELIHKWKNDNDYAVMARRWTKTVAILLGVAIPSGTIVGVQLSLLWPGFMKIVGQVISVPFQIEIFAFFLEALALSIYAYAADRLRPSLRVLSVFLVALGATASAVLITSVNTWMNNPTGFSIKPDGTLYNVDPWKAFFNPNFWNTSYHVVVSALMTGAFAIVSVAAWRLLKAGERERTFHRKALILSLAVAFVMSFLTALSGHGSAQNLHRYNPEKLAVAEGLFRTQAYAPLTIGGWVDSKTREIRYGIEIPYLLSWLAGDRFDTVVKGLEEFPEETWPPFYTHVLFNIMVGIGLLLLFLSGYAIYFWWRRHQKEGRPFPRWLLRSLVASGPLSILGIEFGWIFSCSGRQPWTIYRVQTTAEAATRSEQLGLLFVLFTIVYVLLAFMTVAVVIHYFRKHPLEADREFIQSKGGKSHGAGH
jgi:cytochrome d ubiquinol oxidase subunit I